MSKTVYEHFDTATRGINAYVIMRGGIQIGKVVAKHATATRAFVQYYGTRMSMGSAGGGGYNRENAAIEEAAQKHLKINPDLAGWEKEFWEATAKETGHGWIHELREVGFEVIQVI